MYAAVRKYAKFGKDASRCGEIGWLGGGEYPREELGLFKGAIGILMLLWRLQRTRLV